MNFIFSVFSRIHLNLGIKKYLYKASRNFRNHLMQICISAYFTPRNRKLTKILLDYQDHIKQTN